MRRDVTSLLGRRRGAPETPRALPEPTSAYWTFYDQVAATQLGEWLPTNPGRVLDLTPDPWRRHGAQVDDTHEVVRRVAPDLAGLAPASFDAVIAESGALSHHLVAESTLDACRDLLRPGGRLLLCVDSLALGLAQLAELGRWAELADVPSADVVLVPAEDGTVKRCFWPEELDALLRSCRYDVEWTQPRTVLSATTVERALDDDPSALATLVTTEVALARERRGESTGIRLVSSARRS